jgi:secretory phospholipase A2
MLIWAFVLSTSHGRGLYRQRKKHNTNRDTVFLDGSFEGSDRKDVTYITTRFTKDGEFEVRVSHKGIKGIETVIPKEGEDGLFYRLVTDGKRLVSSIYTDQSHLVDCDINKDEHQMIKFMERFLGSEDTYLDASKGFGERNVTMRVLGNEQLPDIYKPLVNFQTLKSDCRKLHKELRKIEKEKKKEQSQVPSNDDLDSLLDDAIEEKESVEKSHTKSHSRQKRAMFIYPGTKWCGSGSTSHNWDDLGDNIATDKCCRQHDHCPYVVEGFTTKYNLFNYRFHTLSHCNCDEDFRDCLKSAGNSVANMVGSLYFNVVGTKCFLLKPEKVCMTRSWWGTCIKHAKEYTAYIDSPMEY